MKNYQKEMEQVYLDDEKACLNQLSKQYKRALKETKAKVKDLSDDIDRLKMKLSLNASDDDQKEIIESQIQSKVYQKGYQEMLEKQLGGYIDKLKDENTTTVSRYLKNVYEDAYYGTVYGLHKEGIDIVQPVNQKLMIHSIQHGTKNMTFSKRLYKNVEQMKKDTINEVQRGLATGMSYTDIGRNIENVTGVSHRKANMIAQNEGQRVKQNSILESMKDAKAKGADIVKVWDATLDGKTRPHHRELDGQWAELDEKFKYSGGEVEAPKNFGIASEDINCRCTVMTLPRWEIDKSTPKFDNELKQMTQSQNYSEWKKEYTDFYKNNMDLYVGSWKEWALENEKISSKMIYAVENKMLNSSQYY